jgi:hypothetical protein
MGTITDFLFLDYAWAVRYLVVATRAAGSISGTFCFQLAWGTMFVDSKSEVQVGLTRELVSASPDVDSDKSVTRQNEILLADH